MYRLKSMIEAINRVQNEGDQKMRTRRMLGVALCVLFAVSCITLVESARAEEPSTAIVFTDPLAVQATDVGQEFVVNINVSNVADLYAWQAGITFNPEVLECTGFFEGEFLRSQGSTWFLTHYKDMNNTLGIVYYRGAVLWGPVAGVNGSGQLAYATFTSVGIGISDFHLNDVILVNTKIEKIAFEVNENVTVSISGTDYGIGVANNLTGESSPVNPPFSGMFDAAFNATEKKVSFDVSSVTDWFFEISVPKSLLKSSTPSDWTVKVSNASVPYTVNENITYTSLYFEHPQGSYAVEVIGTEVADTPTPPPVPPVLPVPPVPHGTEVTPQWTGFAPPWTEVADISARVRAVPQVAIVLIAMLGLASLIFAVLDIRRTRKTLDQRTATPPSNSSSSFLFFG